MRFTTAALLLALSCASPAAQPEKRPAVVANLHYGAALFDYLSGHHRRALVELKRGENRGGIEGHGDYPRLLEGGVSLAYGMDRRASAILTDMLARTEDAEARDTAWYYLAQMRYVRGDWQGAEQAAARISDSPPRAFEQELLALRFNLALKAGELEKASALVQQEDFADPWLPYLYYNLGAAYSRAGDFDAAIPYYNRLAQLPLHTEQARGLYDRAMTAAGQSYLHAQAYTEAQAQFSRVRLHSPLSSDALLGYGWAAAQQENFLEALAPWQRLAGQSLADENAQEALVAVPYAYERLGHRGEAVKHFQRAQQRLSDEIHTVELAIDRVQEEGVIADALQLQGSGSFNWMDAGTQQQLEPQLVYLADLFSRDSFQGQLGELRDLVEIRNNLEEWDHKLTLYREALEQRGPQSTVGLDQQELHEKIQRLRQRRSDLAEDLLRAREAYKVSSTIPELPGNGDLGSGNGDPVTGRGDGTRGGDSHTDNSSINAKSTQALGDAERQLAALDKQLRSLEVTKSRVELLTGSADDISSYRERMAASHERVTEQLRETQAIITIAEQRLREVITAELREQHDRLEYYLAQSRLAVARLYDSNEVAE